MTLDEHYRPAPADWTVVLTDVKGSTRAIEEGRYRDVNRIGAASIACARRAMGEAEFPYVFGGDGAALLAPPDTRAAVLEELACLKSLSQRRFKLDLRVGAVPVGELKQSGAAIEVARFELAAGKCIALFRGGGLEAAERLIKGNEARYGVESGGTRAPDLDELSCRWNLVPASLGRSLAVMVAARGGHARETYRQVLEGFERIVDHGLDAANPIRHERMTYRGWRACARDEARHYRTVFCGSFLKKLAGIGVAVLSLKRGWNPGFFDPIAYARSIPSHSDYRKFDDALRLILDCAPRQAEALEAFLEDFRRQGRLYYGLHGASSSLMTCFVQSTEPGKHIHFVDGGDGGYAMAAKQLKAQKMAAAESP